MCLCNCVCAGIGPCVCFQVYVSLRSLLLDSPPWVASSCGPLSSGNKAGCLISGNETDAWLHGSGMGCGNKKEVTGGRSFVPNP